MIFMLAETTGSDILDHVLVALVVSLPLLIPVLVGMRRQRAHVDRAAARIEKVTQERINHTTANETVSTGLLRSIEGKLDDHLVNSEEFWEEQRAEMNSLAQALGEHTQDHHVHEVAVGNARKATSEPLHPAKRTPQSPHERRHPKATGG